jgi:hypothetical protein
LAWLFTGPAGAGLADLTGATDSSITGRGAHQSRLFPQITVCATLTTALPRGLASKGRIYLPALEKTETTGSQFRGQNLLSSSSRYSSLLLLATFRMSDRARITPSISASDFGLSGVACLGGVPRQGGVPRHGGVPRQGGVACQGAVHRLPRSLQCSRRQLRRSRWPRRPRPLVNGSSPPATKQSGANG